MWQGPVPTSSEDYFIFCLDCLAQGPPGETWEEALNNWSERL